MLSRVWRIRCRVSSEIEVTVMPSSSLVLAMQAFNAFVIDTGAGEDVPSRSATTTAAVSVSNPMTSAASRGRGHSGSPSQTFSSVRREMSSLFQRRSGSGVARRVSVTPGAQTSRSQCRVSAAPYSRARLISRLFCVLSRSTDATSPTTPTNALD